VGDWGSEAATAAASSQGLASPPSQGSAGEGDRLAGSAGGSGFGGLGDAEAVVKADVGSTAQIVGDGSDLAMSATAGKWKPEGVGRAGGVAAAGGYGSDVSSFGDAGFTADQGRAQQGGGSSMQPASAVGNAGQQIEGSGGNITGGVGSEFGERADFEAGGGILDGVAGRVAGLDDPNASLMDGIMNLGGVAGASYEGIPGVGQGSGASQMQNPAAGSTQGSAGSVGQGSAGGAGQGSAAMDGLPEGRLAAGGEDAQAAVSVDASGSNAAITSDSTAQRIEQVYGVGPEASTGAAEAEAYKAEAEQDKGQSA
jgi:hypothetical protein